MKGSLFFALLACAFCVEFPVEADDFKLELPEINLEFTEQQKQTALNCLAAIGKGTPCYIKIAELVITKNLWKIASVIMKCTNPALEIVSDCIVPLYNKVKEVVQEEKAKRG